MTGDQMSAQMALPDFCEGPRAGGLKRRLRMLFASLGLAGLAVACSGTGKRPEPSPLPNNAALLGVKQVWTIRLGEEPMATAPAVAGTRVAVAGQGGSVLALDASSGQTLWRHSVGDRLSAGVGFDGKRAAVVTANNELIVIQDGQPLWKAKMTARVFTPPFVAGDRVFVMAADRSVHAFDGARGTKLWTHRRSSDALSLSEAGTILAVGDTLLVGLGAKLVGLDPTTASVRWEIGIASPRGANDIERMADIVSGFSRQGQTVCVRAFQSSVGCVNASRGRLLWSRSANGVEGIHGDGQLIVGTEADDRLIAWRQEDGTPAWQTTRLQHRRLGRPLLLGRSLVVGDGDGLLHFLSRDDGSALTRVSTDGTAVLGDPVVAGDTLIVATKAGGVFAFRPE